MNKEELEARIRALDTQIDMLGTERSILRQRLAQIQTTFKVGDRVTYEESKHVWELTAIRPGYDDKPEYYGSKIKKDGTPAKLVSRLWAPWRKEFYLVDSA
jgi:hypothetical protein